MNIKFNKSHSYSELNLLIDQLPLLSFDNNLIRPFQIVKFMKELTGIDSDYKGQSFDEIESLILNDLQLYLNYYYYYSKKASIWKKIVRFLYQPVSSIRTIYNDYQFIKEVNKVFNIHNKDEIVNFIDTVDKKIEKILISFNGELRSIHILIYSALKAQNHIIVNLIKIE